MRGKGNGEGRRAKARVAPLRRSAAVRPLRPARERDDSAQAKPARSAPMQLAAEVERLEQELAAARTRVTQLETLADVDSLLDILNRRGFERELKRSLAYVKRHGTDAALVYLDLDDFKPINDRHGHAAGDAMLKAVAETLARVVRASDVVARIGGDEFAVLLWNCSETDAQAKAQVLEAAISRTTVTHAGVKLSVGVSTGVAALLPLDAPADVLERADRAMYGRKAERRRGLSAAGY
jgi:diguanylate cyclase (GGDEF)-like protein